MKTLKQFIFEDAESLTVYHGTSQRFKKFDQKKARLPNDLFGGGVAYFTTSKNIAMSYARATAKKHPDKLGLVYTCEIRLNNIFDVDDAFTGQQLVDLLPKDTEKFARGAGLLTIRDDKYEVLSDLERGNATLTGEQVFNGLSSGMNTTAKAREHLKKHGYDGLRYNGGQIMGAESHDVYLVYYADDITITKRQRFTMKKETNESIQEKKSQATSIVNLLKQKTIQYVNSHGKMVEITNIQMFEALLSEMFGATMIGSGSYARAFRSEDGEWVLKHMDGDWYDPFKDYADLSIKKGGKGLYPKILWKGNRFGRDIVILEAVKILGQAGRSAFPKPYNGPTEFSADLQGAAYLFSGDPGAKLIYGNINEFDRALKKFKSSGQEYRKWVETINNYKDLDFRTMADIHHGNCGLRKDNSLVIFDPLG